LIERRNDRGMLEREAKKLKGLTTAEDEILLGKEIDPKTFRIDMASGLCICAGGTRCPARIT
jgi:hypothetical protein